jgi:hypothetical protein
MRSTALGTMVGAVVLMGSAAAAQEVRDPLQPTVRLLVINRATIRPEVLASAEEDATRIYRAAGVHISWLNGPASASDSRPVSLTLMIVSGENTHIMVAASKLDDVAMGYAPVNSTSDAVRSRLAYVFFDRVEDNATKHHMAIKQLLGQVMAHEAGHLLLPFNSHSERGLMRATWDLRSGLVEYFTTAQAEMIRQRAAALARQ